MGSLDPATSPDEPALGAPAGAYLKRTAVYRIAAASVVRRLFHRPRSRVTRFLLFEKVDCLQLIASAAAFLFVLVVFHSLLPSSLDGADMAVLEFGSGGSGLGGGDGHSRDLEVFEFGDGFELAPKRLVEKWERERRAESARLLRLGRPVHATGIRKPKLAFVFADLIPDAMQIQMVSVAVALMEMGYEIQVLSFEDGDTDKIWRNIGASTYILSKVESHFKAVNWLDYSAIFINSLDSRPAVTSLLQDPYKAVPVIWTIQENSLFLHSNRYNVSHVAHFLNDWKQAFCRATVVVFADYVLPIIYSSFDAGNFLVVPGSPADVLRADKFLPIYDRNELRRINGFGAEDFIIVIVGSQISYTGMWLEQMIILQALEPLLQRFPCETAKCSRLKIRISNGRLTDTNRMDIEAAAVKMGFPSSTVGQFRAYEGLTSLIGMADLVIYGSFLEEQSFPSVLIEAMSLGKLVIAPNVTMITKIVIDGVNGFLFSKDNVGMLAQRLLQIVTNKGISELAQRIASTGKELALNMMASGCIKGYISLLENVIKLPSEMLIPKTVEDVPSPLKSQWQWHLFENVTDLHLMNQTFRGLKVLKKLEDEWLRAQMKHTQDTALQVDDAFSPIVWEEENLIETMNLKRRLEEEQLKDRNDQPHGTWEEVYRNVKKAERTKNELHERDEKELERTGQPLCIYEPFLGEGTWSFLHQTSLYRGISLSSKGRRPGADDIDASSRLPLLNTLYYRDVLGDFGAYFALANRIDKIHKNSWIGFQSWKATAKKATLSKKAEAALLQSIQEQKHGDALYFWVRMDQDPRYPAGQDFWSFCDTINAGNCRFAVSEALRQMYGLQADWKSLPSMPGNGGTWSAMQCWALPTRSFLEFVMFSRMFVDALDTLMYDEHHQSGYCYLSTTKDWACYSRVLEFLVNVWAYHSARHIVYVDPETGAMQEQHPLAERRGQMWIKWFSYATLKSMDEDLAELADYDHPDKRWLWKSTGEVFWQGVYEKEHNMRQEQKKRRKQQSEQKIRRIRSRARQKTLGKYIKPPPEDVNTDGSNHTRTN